MAAKKKFRAIGEYFQTLADRRQEGKIKHKLSDIILLCLCGMIAKLDSWEEIESFCKHHIAIFKQFLELPNDIPSHDTMERVMRTLNPKELKRCLSKLVYDLRKIVKGDVVSIDGKTLKATAEDPERKTALHLVHAWSSANGLLLGQYQAGSHVGEITAIPELLDTLQIEGCTITIDAIGCQVKIAQKIKKKKADFVLALKGNQETTAKEVADYFKFAESCKFLDIPAKEYVTLSRGHGRIEKREVYVLTDLTDLPSSKKWPGLEAVVMIRTHRTLRDVTTVSERYYLTSLTDEKAIAHAIRSHWNVENQLHWSLDVVWGEDRKRDRKDYAGLNMATLRRFALTLLRADTSLKMSAPRKRGLATWDINYLVKIIFGE